MYLKIKNSQIGRHEREQKVEQKIFQIIRGDFSNGWNRSRRNLQQLLGFYLKDVCFPQKRCILNCELPISHQVLR